MQRRATSEPFEAELDSYGATSVITVRGELDMAFAATLASAMRRALDDAPQLVVVDLSALSFIDVAGVRALLSAHRHARAQGAETTIIPAPAVVQRVFALMGVDAGLPFAPARPDRRPPPSGPLPRRLAWSRVRS
jgi:anti-sigma B factor antagonist